MGQVDRWGARRAPHNKGNNMFEELTDKHQLRYQCRYCNHTNPTFDSAVRWNEDRQEWEVAVIATDRVYCTECDKEGEPMKLWIEFPTS